MPQGRRRRRLPSGTAAVASDREQHDTRQQIQTSRSRPGKDRARGGGGGQRQRRRRRQRRSSGDADDEPFPVLFVKVGVFVFVCGVAMYVVLVNLRSLSGGGTGEDDGGGYYADDDGSPVVDAAGGGPAKEQVPQPPRAGRIGRRPPDPTDQKGGGNNDGDIRASTRGSRKGSGRGGAESVIIGTDDNEGGDRLRPLPTFELDEREAAYDAFGLAGGLLSSPGGGDDGGGGGGGSDAHDSSSDDDESSFLDEFDGAASALRDEFAARYGGANAARFILQRGKSTFAPAAAAAAATDPPPADPPADGSYRGNNSNLEPDADDGRRRRRRSWSRRSGPTKDEERATFVPDATLHLARRILRSRSERRPFVMSFGGYSVTAGRGNYHAQSYPRVLERILSGPMGSLGIELVVRNAGIGGVPSFPYGWCLPNFLGVDSDVVSWDFSYNEPMGDGTTEEGEGGGGLEAFLRHALTLERRPMLIVKDDTEEEEEEERGEEGEGGRGRGRGGRQERRRRRDVLQAYTDLGAISDALLLHTGRASRPFLSLLDDDRGVYVTPPGFADWREFGAPPGAPGRAKHHPAVREHEFDAWIIGMHFLGALEVAARCLRAPEGGGSSFGPATTTAMLPPRGRGGVGRGGSYATELPPPMVAAAAGGGGDGAAASSSHLSSLFYGRPATAGESRSRGGGGGGDNSKPPQHYWTMDAVHCRTSYDPILGGRLRDIVVSGTAFTDHLDLMLPRGYMFYNSGWVLDLGDAEKRAKRKLERYGGLGFVDTKKALYGVNASGTLGLFVPYEGEGRGGGAPSSPRVVGGGNGTRRSGGGGGSRGRGRVLPSEGADARRWFRSLVVCEVNEKRGDRECDMERDVSFAVGGQKVETVERVSSGSSSYLGKKICLDVGIPEGAKLATLSTDPSKKGSGTSKGAGLSLGISVINPRVTIKDGACSISHVVWQQNAWNSF